MKSAITVSLTPEARSGPFVFHDGLPDACLAAAKMGFDAVEIFPPSASAIDQNELRSLLQRHGLRAAAFGTGAGMVVHKWSLAHPDAEVRSKARAFIREIIDLAGAFQAPAIIGSMQGKAEGEVSLEQAHAWLAEALEDLGEHAAQYGQPLLFEFLNRYETNLFNRVEPTAKFLRGLQTKNVRILADLFHMNIEEADLEEAIVEGGDLIAHVHFADSNRQAVGFGHTMIEPVIVALRRIGYTGYLSAEVFPKPFPLIAAQQTSTSFHHYVH